MTEGGGEMTCLLPTHTFPNPLHLDWFCFLSLTSFPFHTFVSAQPKTLRSSEAASEEHSSTSTPHFVIHPPRSSEAAPSGQPEAKSGGI